MKNTSHLDRFLKNDTKMLEYLGAKEELERYKQALKAHAEALLEFNEEEKQKKKGWMKSKKDGKRENSFTHGTRVRATYLTSNKASYKYIGTVVEVHGDKTLSISYDDGDFWGQCPFDCAFLLDEKSSVLPKRSAPQLSRFLQQFKVGLKPVEVQALIESEIFTGKRVMAGWRVGVSKYAGVIRSVNKRKKTVEMSYDDGDYWDSCPWSTLSEIEAIACKCCPSCFILIHKAEGCDSMRCVCGKPFSWNNTPVIPTTLLDAMLEREKEDCPALEDEGFMDARCPDLEDDRKPAAAKKTSSFSASIPFPPPSSLLRPPSGALSPTFSDVRGFEPSRIHEDAQVGDPVAIGSPGKRRRIGSGDNDKESSKFSEKIMGMIDSAVNNFLPEKTAMAGGR